MSEFTFDHIVPRSQGGITRWENVVVSCLPCNQRKADRAPEQAGMKLLVKPTKPKTLPGSLTPVLKWEEGMPETWREYLGSIEYWHGKLDEA
jgi:5-methylcytosine-specific restriction endonuclease McrA